MTISSVTNRVSYTGNGSTTAFAFSHPFRLTADLVVTVRTTATGAESLKVEGSDYTVSGTADSGTGGYSSGTVTFSVAPASGTQVHIDRVVTRTQTSDFISGDGIPPADIEGALDKLSLAVQELDSRFGRTLLQPRTAANRDLVLPEPSASTANKVLAVNSGGTAYAATSMTGINQIATVLDYGAVGGGVTNDATAFSSANTAGKLTIIPKVTGGYELTSTVSTTAGAWLVDPTLSWSDATDDGQLDLRRGHFTGSGNGSNIWRFADRVFVGEAASKFAAAAAGVPDAGTSWLSDDSDGPAFLGVGAGLLVTMPETNDSGGRYAVVGAAKLSASTNASGIGTAGAIINNKNGASGWALYGDVVHNSDGISHGLEVACKNVGADLTATPYTDNNGVYGLWCQGGGDNAYGPAAANPSNSAFAIVKGAHTWNSGILFKDDSLTGTDGTSGSTGTGVAMMLARRHAIRWYEPTNSSIGAQIASSVTATANKVGVNFADLEVQFLAPNDAIMGAVVASGTVANYLALTGRPTGSAARLDALGSDTNIDIWLNAKGAGVARFGTHTATADTAISGYITIKDAGGTTRKLAVIT